MLDILYDLHLLSIIPLILELTINRYLNPGGYIELAAPASCPDGGPDAPSRLCARKMVSSYPRGW